jgi:SAM-dependent MidA family methyltransferase
MQSRLIDSVHLLPNNVLLRASLLEESDVATVFLAMELLDNLPHDKIRRNRVSRQFEQAEVHVSNADQLDEVFVPLEDPLLCEILDTYPSYGGMSLGRPTWIPTVACGVLAHLAKVRPNSCLSFFDFDYLPPPDLVSTKQRRSTLGNGEPLITSMDEIDHECYLDAPLFCDILFPVDFPKLAPVAKKYWTNGARVEIMKQFRFLERYGTEEVNATKSWLTGYSPLIHDFGNCSVLTVTNDNKQSE